MENAGNFFAILIDAIKNISWDLLLKNIRVGVFVVDCVEFGGFGTSNGIKRLTSGQISKFSLKYNNAL